MPLPSGDSHHVCCLYSITFGDVMIQMAMLMLKGKVDANITMMMLQAGYFVGP